MKVKNITEQELRDALTRVNLEHNYKLIFNREPEKVGNFYHFTIRSEKSGIPGARYSHSGRKLVSASWHAHGYLFDAILAIRPDAIIKSWNAEIYVNRDGLVVGNWQDWDAGSYFAPAKMSSLSIQ